MTSRLQLREDARRARQALTDRADRSERIVARLFSLPEFVAARVVLFYVDVRTEVQTQAALGQAEAGKTIVVPYCVGDRLKLFHWQHARDLVRGAFGILEPRDELLVDPARRIEPAQIDLVLVPGLVFDLAGHRLGYGRGYYDRLLAELPPRTKRIGLAFDCQIVDTLPREEHDQPMEQILTETREIRCC